MDQDENSPDIVFEGESQSPSASSFEAGPSKAVQMLMRYSGGAIKNEKQAGSVLAVFAIVILIISLFLFFGHARHLKPPAPSITGGIPSS